VYIAVAVVALIAFAVIRAVLNDSSTSSSSSSGADVDTSSWTTGDCGGPDPSSSSGAYLKLKCSASGATFKALEIKEPSIVGQVQCPAGTDIIIKVSRKYGSGSGSGIPTNTVCGRNLTGDHPGDAGAGGGQLVAGDCVGSTAQEIACAGAPQGSYKVLALAKTKGECPSGTTEPMELVMAIGRPYDVICAGTL
jgi:hypothetical protein